MKPTSNIQHPTSAGAVSYIEDPITQPPARQPRVAIVLGSGLGAFADELTDRIEVPYSDIPGWPVSTAVGHAGRLVFGKLATSAPEQPTTDNRQPTTEVVAMSGRVHLYEGYTPQQVTFGVR